jgi:hypothetical protein
VLLGGKVYSTPAGERFRAAAREIRMPGNVHVGFNCHRLRADEPLFLFPDADHRLLKAMRDIPDYLERAGGWAPHPL